MRDAVAGTAPRRNSTSALCRLAVCLMGASSELLCHRDRTPCSLTRFFRFAFPNHCRLPCCARLCDCESILHIDHTARGFVHFLTQCCKHFQFSHDDYWIFFSSFYTTIRLSAIKSPPSVQYRGFLDCRLWFFCVCSLLRKLWDLGKGIHKGRTSTKGQRKE